MDLEEVWGQAFRVVGRSWQAEAGGSVSLLAETLWGISGENRDQSLARRLWGKELFAIALIFSRGQPGVWPHSPGALHDAVDTTFVALPGKWANLSFNLFFDVAFLNNHRFTFSFLSLLLLMQNLSLCVYYFKMFEGIKQWFEGSEEVFAAVNSLFSLCKRPVVCQWQPTG